MFHRVSSASPMQLCAWLLGKKELPSKWVFDLYFNYTHTVTISLHIQKRKKMSPQWLYCLTNLESQCKLFSNIKFENDNRIVQPASLLHTISYEFQWNSITWPWLIPIFIIFISCHEKQNKYYIPFSFTLINFFLVK